MDSLTQIVLGAAVGEAVAGRKIGGKAALWGAIAGTLPDLDVFARGFVHPIDAALIHRGFSHSIVFACIVGPLLGYLVHRLYKRKFEQGMWIQLFFWAIITHPMLDIFTNYGTEFFWPFSVRLTFNSVFVIDPLYTVPFLILLMIALFLKRSNPWRKRLNMTGIIYSTLYLIWGLIVKLVILSSSPGYFEESKITANRISVGPMPATTFYWMILGETDSSFVITYKSLFSEYKPKDLEVIPKVQKQLNEIHWPEGDFASTLKFVSNGYYTTDRVNDTLYFYDLRFGTSRTLTDGQISIPVMGYGMVVDNGIVQKTTGIRNRGALSSLNFDAYWNRVFGKYGK